jgi:haloalkane dehalogenase
MLTWPRQIPIEGEPPEVVQVATDCGRWLAESRIPKLFINAEPGAILTGRQREFCRTWRNQTEVTVEGNHFVQEDSPNEIGEALSGFVRSLRNLWRMEKVNRRLADSQPVSTRHEFEQANPHGRIGGR